MPSPTARETPIPNELPARSNSDLLARGTVNRAYAVRGFEAVQEAVSGLHGRSRLCVVCAAALAGFLLVINSSWTASPDAALYLALGESLARGEGYAFEGVPHTFVPPGYPLIVAAFARLFGADFLVYRILMSMLGLITAAAGYWLVRRLYGPDTALLAGGAFALNHVLLENSALTLADVPFALFTVLALHAALSAAQGAGSRGILVLAADPNKRAWGASGPCLLSLVLVERRARL